MKYSTHCILFILMIFQLPAFAQTDSTSTELIDFPYSTMKFKIRERQVMKMLILKTTTDSLIVTPIRNWQRIKGETKEMKVVDPVLLPIYGEKAKKYSIPYTDLEELKLVTTLRNPDRRPKELWNGALIGVGAGVVNVFFIGGLVSFFSCLDEEEDCRKEKFAPILLKNVIAGGIIGTVIDYSIDMRLNISIGKNLKKQTNQEWRKALKEYSILR